MQVVRLAQGMSAAYTYEDDVSTDGVLRKEWVQCMKCRLWMHED